jgi:malonyl-CoA O-methyltransferase
MSALAVREAYREWAPSYSDETVISWLENELVSDMTPPLDGLRLLDAGCGTGRRIEAAPAATRVGFDVSPEMLAAGIGGEAPCPEVQTLVGDVRDIPLQSRSFDLVWCRLVLGHLPTIGAAYSELARVADHGATVIVSDFHPAAVEAGHRRTFSTGSELIEVEHYVHHVADHLTAARDVGLELTDRRDALIGEDVRSFYERAGKHAAYRDHVGLPVVLALAFRKGR